MSDTGTTSNITLPKVALGATGFTVSRLGLGGFHQVEISSEIVEQVVYATQFFLRGPVPVAPRRLDVVAADFQERIHDLFDDL